MAVLTELLGAKPVCAGYRRLAESDHAAAFETGKQSVLILWEEEEGPLASVGVSASAKLRWLDLMGREVAPRPVKLSTSPLYLVGPAGKAKELLESLRVSAGKGT